MSSLMLLGDLAQTVGQVSVGPQALREFASPVPILAGLVAKTPGISFIRSEGSLPEGTGLLSYFQLLRQSMSQWKEDLEELEILVNFFFSLFLFSSLMFCWQYRVKALVALLSKHAIRLTTRSMQ